MLPYYIEYYGNPSAAYDYATQSRRAMNEARKQIADVIGADITEIYFTSGGTEADNWAIMGAAEAFTFNSKKSVPGHVITTQIEHHAVLNSCKHLESLGYEVTYVPVNEFGIVDVKNIEKAIKPNTCLISVMMANNEIGSIQPIKEIGRLANDHSIMFHTDAVQSFGHIPIDVNEMNIDMLSASAHKCHGPKGIGFLFIRNGIKIPPYQHGGKQERRVRAGTENVPSIVGFGEAAHIINSRLLMDTEYILKLRNHFTERVINEIENVKINGSTEQRLPGNINFSFKSVNGEAVQIQLDFNNICCSTGSACNAGSKKISHVMEAINMPAEYANGSVRFSLSSFNTVDEINETVDILKEVILKLRDMENMNRL